MTDRQCCPRDAGTDTRVAGVVVRAAVPAEYGAVAELTVAVYGGEGYVRAGSPYLAELADTARRAAAAQVLVAEYDGRIVGSLTVAPAGNEYADIARPGEIEFRMLAVAADARGLGAGTALVRTVIDIARTKRNAAVVLTTMPSMVDARRIYDRLGFVPVPERNWLTPAGDPLTVLRLPLAAAD